MVAFICLVIAGAIFLVRGISAFYAQKQQTFWSGGKAPKVDDLKKWNSALGKLFCSYGLSVILVGLVCLLPVSDILKSVLLSTVPIGGIIVMTIVYIKIIAPKYRVK